jgi:MYXO-CTERM domain-containing protein
MRNASRTSGALAVALLLLLTAGSAKAAINLLTNPGFESPNASAGDVYASANWNGFNDVYTHAAANAHSGTQDLKVFGPFFQFGGAGAVQGGFAASPGQTWEASAFLLNDSADPIQGSNFAVVKIEFLNSGNAVIGSAESPHFTAANPQNLWTPELVQSVAPANTTSAQIVLVHVQLNSPVTGGSVFFDDASFSVVPEPGSMAAALFGVAGLAIRRRSRSAGR